MGNRTQKKNYCKKIKFLNNLATDSFTDNWLSNTFIAFKSINDIYFLIYANHNKSLIFYDIINNKKITEIKNAHKCYISNLRYYLDINNNRDLFLSISSYDSNLKIWNISNLECLLDIKNINKSGYLYSACFFQDNNRSYFITSKYDVYKENINPELIKVFDFKGNKIKEIDESYEYIYFIDTYYENRLSKIFIIACNKNMSKSYDYYKNELYQKYNDNANPLYIVVKNEKEIVKLFESNYDGILRLYNFHTGLLLKKIKLSYNSLREISFWDDEYLFVASDDKTIKLVDYKIGKKIKELKGHNRYVTSLKQIIHPQYGKCLISQGAFEEPIKLWIIKN